MAKGARASSKKANNTKLKSHVFGPVESARTQRLSDKLLELASAPRPQKENDKMVMDAEEENLGSRRSGGNKEAKETQDMELDQPVTATMISKTHNKGRIEKRRSSRKRSIVFTKFEKGKRTKRAKEKR